MTDFPAIPGFTCDAVLGRGGMAVVYSAVENALGRHVAIKVVSAGDSDEAQHLRRLEQEARGLANLQHPHIVELHSFGRTKDGALYYVMPMLDGGDLRSRPKPLPEWRVVELLDALLGALAHAHASGLVHRDIKPANILFDRYDRPLLGDFGAAFVRGAQRITDRDMTIGSTEYMSPEQARGTEVDARSDLYSLGVLAFEYLTGRLPFEGEDDLAIALAKEEQPVPRVPRALAHWQSFLDRALAARVDRRFADAESMRAALPGGPGAAAAPHRSRRVAIASALAIAALAALAWFVVPRAPAPSVVVATAPSPAPASPASVAEAIGIAPTPGSPAVPAVTPEATREATAVELPAPTPIPDPGGPALVRVATGDGRTLDVAREPVGTALYRRFLVATGRPVFDCPAAPRPTQGCITVADAERFAAWLSQETGARYRLPTRHELRDAAPQLARVAARAWSSSCDERRVEHKPNVARRAWSGVREVFGKSRIDARTTVTCAGHFAVALDGRGRDAEARDRAAPDTVVVLVRD